MLDLGSPPKVVFLSSPHLLQQIKPFLEESKAPEVCKRNGQWQPLEQGHGMWDMGHKTSFFPVDPWDAEMADDADKAQLSNCCWVFEL